MINQLNERKNKLSNQLNTLEKQPQTQAEKKGQISENLRKLGFKCEFAGSTGGLGSCDDPMSYVKDIKKQAAL